MSPKIASSSVNRRTIDGGDGVSNDSSHRRGLRAAFASIAGLVIHAAADGIAMGASAGSGDESLKLIILFAIMIHKAVSQSSFTPPSWTRSADHVTSLLLQPASFGLCTLLMGRRLQKSDIYKAILVFSLSTPVGALFSEYDVNLFPQQPINHQNQLLTLPFLSSLHRPGSFLLFQLRGRHLFAAYRSGIDIQRRHIHLCRHACSAGAGFCRGGHR